MDKPIKFNIGYLVDIVAIATTIAFCVWVKSRQETSFKFLVASILVFAILLALFVFFSDTKVTNESSETAYYKPETANQPNELGKRQSVYGVDGIKSRGKVYKMVDGTHATITDSGIKVHSFTAKLLNAVMGSVNKPLNSPPAPDWQSLFEYKASSRPQ